MAYVKKFKRTVSLAELRDLADQLGDLALIRTGNRLSVMPVTKAQYDLIVGLAGA